MRLRGTIAVLSALSLATLALAGCSTGGNSTAGAGGGSSGGSSGGSTATATMTGDLTGTVAMNVCTDGGADSIKVTVKGDSTSYLGQVSQTGFGFVGPDGAAYGRDTTQSTVVPVAIPGEPGGYSVDGVQAFSKSGGATKKVTLSGKLVCP
jgi:hypothetical protein